MVYAVELAHTIERGAAALNGGERRLYDRMYESCINSPWYLRSTPPRLMVNGGVVRVMGMVATHGPTSVCDLPVAVIAL